MDSLGADGRVQESSKLALGGRSGDSVSGISISALLSLSNVLAEGSLAESVEETEACS